MKFLCICQYGHSRSAGLVRSLHAKKQEAVAAGYATSPSALAVLGEWADVIVICSVEYKLRRPELQHLQSKVVYFPIGPDKWSNPYHHELKAICDTFVSDIFGAFNESASRYHDRADVWTGGSSAGNP